MKHCDKCGVYSPDCHVHECGVTVKKPAADNVVWPTHYNQGDIQPLDAMLAAFGKESVKDFCVCNAMKYIFRHKLKNRDEDLKKAVFYLRFALGDDPRAV